MTQIRVDSTINIQYFQQKFIIPSEMIVIRDIDFLNGTVVSLNTRQAI